LWKCTIWDLEDCYIRSPRRRLLQSHVYPDTCDDGNCNRYGDCNSNGYCDCHCNRNCQFDSNYDAGAESNIDTYGYSYDYAEAESYCQAKPNSTDASYSTATALARN
jgi:hypothetical protein